jgi:translation elongation factor EF-1beta
VDLKGHKMGKVIVTVRVVSENAEIEKIIKETIKPEKIEKKPFVFGLEAIIFEKIVEEKEGELENLEEKLRELNVSYEILKVTRVFLE